MGDLGRRLGQQQALLGRGREEPPASPFLDQRLVVERRLEAEQAEPEPVLTARLAVASARVAAELGEDRHDLVGEVDRPPAANSRTVTGTSTSRPPDRTVIVAVPSPCADDQARGVDRRRPRVRAGELGRAGQVPRLASPAIPSTASCWTESGPRSTACGGTTADRGRRASPDAGGSDHRPRTQSRRGPQTESEHGCRSAEVSRRASPPPVVGHSDDRLPRQPPGRRASNADSTIIHAASTTVLLNTSFTSDGATRVVESMSCTLVDAQTAERLDAAAVRSDKSGCVGALTG